MKINILYAKNIITLKATYNKKYVAFNYLNSNKKKRGLTTMNEMYIVSFNSTHHAIRTEKILNENNIRCTTLPTPREITASCGISIRFLFEDIEIVKKLLNTTDVDYKGIYKIQKLSDGKKSVEHIG